MATTGAVQLHSAAARQRGSVDAQAMAQAGLCVTYHDQCDWEKNPVTYLRVEMQRRAAIETGQWGISQRARRKALRGIGGHDGSTKVA